MPEIPPRHCNFGPYRLDRLARELRGVGGALIPLTGKAFETLCCLIDRRDRIVGKDELLATVWTGRVVEENNLTQAISTLRRALGNEGHYILTVSGHGYRFVGDIDPGGDDAPPPANAHPDIRARRALHPRSIALAAAALAGALVIAALLTWPSRLPPKSPQLPASVPPTLAVLPFRSLSGPRDELLELGLAETLIARISGSTTLRVRSLASSQRFGRAGQDPLDAARQLGAAYVVEGTTQRRGDLVRVNARLLNVADGRALWSGTFDEQIDRAFTLQDGLGAAVTSALALKVSATPAHSRSPCDGGNAEAYRAYLAGRYQLDRPSKTRMRQALAEFRRAIDLDPSCARAYAGMAYAYRALVMTGDEDPRLTFPLAKAAVEQALVIDPQSAQAYASKGFIQFWYDWDWAGAEASLRRAIALNPSLGEARLAYAHLLANLGRSEQAALQSRQAIALDPLSPLVNTLASSFLGMAGHPTEAKQALDKALELDPDFWIALQIRASAALQQHDYPAAIADLSRSRILCGDCSQTLALLGEAYAQSGDLVRARQVLADMERRAQAGYLPASSMAAVRNALGDTNGALDLLERAYRQRDVRLAFLRIDTRWNGLRSQPRFQALARRIGLPEHSTVSADR